MYEQIRSTFAEGSWMLATAMIAFFTIKGLMWLVVPVIVLRCKRWFVRRETVPTRKQ